MSTATESDLRERIDAVWDTATAFDRDDGRRVEALSRLGDARGALMAAERYVLAAEQALTAEPAGIRGGWSIRP